MANQHITAALRCSQFKGITRAVLVVLADAASSGGKGKDDQKLLPLGYTKRKLATIMMMVNCRRQPTVSQAIAELRKAGAIKVRYRKQGSNLYFVDLDWLRDHAFTDEQIDDFEYAALKVSRLANNQEQAEVLDEVKRLPYNQEYENRITKNTESVTEEYENRLTYSHPFPPCDVPPSEDGSFPPASQDNPSHTEDGKTGDQKPSQEPPHVSSAPNLKQQSAQAQVAAPAQPRKKASAYYLELGHLLISTEPCTKCGCTKQEPEAEKRCTRKLEFGEAIASSKGFVIEEDVEV